MKLSDKEIAKEFGTNIIFQMNMYKRQLQNAEIYNQALVDVLVIISKYKHSKYAMAYIENEIRALKARAGREFYSYNGVTLNRWDIAKAEELAQKDVEKAKKTLKVQTTSEGKAILRTIFFKSREKNLKKIANQRKKQLEKMEQN